MIPHDQLPLDQTQVVSRHTYVSAALMGSALALVACSPSVNLRSAETTANSEPTSLPTTTGSSATVRSPPTTEFLPASSTTQPIANREVPTDETQLIVALTEAEEAIRDPNVTDQEATEWGRLQQRLYRVLANNPEWAPQVVAGVSESARLGVKNNWAARLALTSLVSSAPLAETLPAWKLREPRPAAELLGYYRQAEAETGIAWNYLAAINLVETRMGRIEGFSTAGATGPMQFLPSTWAECCQGDPTVDRDAIIGAGVYLARVGGVEDLSKALFRYNNSQRYVDAVTFYAEVMAEDELAYRGYHAWQVYFLSAAGLILMPSDYYQPEPIPVEEWLGENPDALLTPAE